MKINEEKNRRGGRHDRDMYLAKREAAADSTINWEGGIDDIVGGMHEFCLEIFFFSLIIPYVWVLKNYDANDTFFIIFDGTLIDANIGMGRHARQDKTKESIPQVK